MSRTLIRLQNKKPKSKPKPVVIIEEEEEEEYVDDFEPLPPRPSLTRREIPHIK